MNFEQLTDGSLLEVYSKTGNSDNFLLGYMVSNLEEYVIFKTIDEYGALDSYTLYKKSDIADIRSKSKYIKVFNYYIEFYKANKSFDDFNLAAKFESIPQKNFDEILNYFYKNKKIVSMTILGCDGSNSGEVIKISDNDIILKRSNYYNDFGVGTTIKNITVVKKDILTLDLISKENYLYEQYKSSK